APGRVVLGAREVAYRYRGADRDAIAGISLEFRRGEIAAIVGANGAGKSTLGLVLGRALRPSRGAVSGDARVAYVFQYPERGFLANTVREEMTYAARAGGAVARDADELAELADRAIAMAQGSIGFDGAPAQLFARPDLARFGLALPPVADAFARAHANDPSIEPLAGLDDVRAALDARQALRT